MAVWTAPSPLHGHRARTSLGRAAMKSKLVVAACSALLLAALVHPVEARQVENGILPPDRPISWLSTGDSYSSGEGSQNASGTCQTSKSAWGPKSVKILREERSWRIGPELFSACTGAVTRDFYFSPSERRAWEDAGSGRRPPSLRTTRACGIGRSSNDRPPMAASTSSLSRWAATTSSSARSLPTASVSGRTGGVSSSRRAPAGVTPPSRTSRMKSTTSSTGTIASTPSGPMTHPAPSKRAISLTTSGWSRNAI